MKTVLISGGTGLVGSYLCEMLHMAGYSVRILSRKENTNSKFKTFLWDYQNKKVDSSAFKDVDYVINMAGAGIIDKRWSQKRKQEIIDSRVETTKFLFETIQKENTSLIAFISASAIGYYGTVTDLHIFKEDDTAGNDFLGNTCKQWEDAADMFSKTNNRVVKIRIGVVLSKRGGALEKMALPIRLGLASAIGSGKQFFPWIHIEDLCRMFIYSMENKELSGAYNAVAPEHIDNKSFTKAIAKALNKPIWLPNIPSSFLNLVMGKQAKLLLKGSRISSEKIQSTGFRFEYPDLASALHNLLKK